MIKRENWLLTEKYLMELAEENPYTAPATITRYDFALNNLLKWADDLSFEEALNTKAPNFSTFVSNLPARHGNGKLVPESQKKIILVSKAFLTWAQENREIGAKKILPKKIRSLVHPRIHRTVSDPTFTSLEEIRQILSCDFEDSLLMIRDRAALCFAFLSGGRANAIATAPIKSIDLPNDLFYQFPAWGVETKNGKSDETSLLPIADLKVVVKRWDDIVRSSFPDTEIWYAPLKNRWGEYAFYDDQDNHSLGKNRGQAMLQQFGVIYENAGKAELYKSPHKCRNGHALYALNRCANMAQYHVVSRNLMHADLSITDAIYAVIERKERQGIYSHFTPEYHPAVIENDLETYLKELCKEDRIKALEILAASMRD
jgi:integrase